MGMMISLLKSKNTIQKHAHGITFQYCHTWTIKWMKTTFSIK
jgi:hypothetical protein